MNDADPSPHACLLLLGGVPESRIPSTELAIRSGGYDVVQFADAVTAKVKAGASQDVATDETLAEARAGRYS